jgi:quinol monooxygenase YgiN
MFQLNLRMTAQPHRAVEAVKALRCITIEAQVERGYLASRIYQEVDKPEALCLEEDWSSEPELKSHIRSRCFTELLLLMETLPKRLYLKFGPYLKPMAWNTSRQFASVTTREGKVWRP